MKNAINSCRNFLGEKLKINRIKRGEREFLRSAVNLKFIHTEALYALNMKTFSRKKDTLFCTMYCTNYALKMVILKKKHLIRICGSSNSP
jgi:hypothetical protein